MNKPLNNNNQIELKWKAFLAGNKDAFAYFYNLHIDDLFHYGTNILIDEDSVKDAIQEIFLDLYIKRNSNKTNPKNLKFYLILALKRNLIKRIKKSRKFTENTNEIEFEPEYSIEHQIIDSEQKEELDKKIAKLLSQLPSKQKEAVYLRYNQAMEYKEVAKVLNVTVETARKQVYRALKAIKTILNSENIILFYFLFKKVEYNNR